MQLIEMAKKNGLAKLAFVVATSSWLIWLVFQIIGRTDWIWLFPIPAPVSVVMAFLAYRKKVKYAAIYNGEPYYIAAMVLGIIASAFLIAFIIGGPPDNT